MNEQPKNGSADSDQSVCQCPITRPPNTLTANKRQFCGLLLKGVKPVDAVKTAYKPKTEPDARRKAVSLLADHAVRQHLHELGWTDPAEQPILETDRSRLEAIRDLNMELARNRALTAGERASASKLARDAMRDLQALGNTAPVGDYPELRGFIEAAKRSGLLKKSTVDKEVPPHHPTRPS